MFTQPIPLNPIRHAELRVTETTDYRFAAKEMMIPVVYTEMADVAREYPLVFIEGRDLPVALTGIEAGVNAYVGDDGRWLATYLPGRVQAYPFALTQFPNRRGEYAIVFDTEARQVLRKEGHLLFDASGRPSGFLHKRMGLLKRMQKAESQTVAMVWELRESGLLVSRAIRVKRPQGEDSQLTGMEVIDEKALNALPLEGFGQLRDRGLLPLIYAHLFSMANLRHGAIAGRYPQLAQPQASSALPEEIFPNEDGFKFNFDR